MNMHSAPSFGLSDRVSPPASTAYKLKETENRLLDKATEERLHSLLMLAVLAGRDALQPAVDTIVEVCKAAGQRFFVTRFRNETSIAASIIQCLRPKSVDPIRFGFHWNEHGLGEELLPADSTLRRKPAKVVTKAAGFAPRTYIIPPPKALPDDEQARLTRVLRMAVADAAYLPIMRALEQIIEACKTHGVTRFMTPYGAKTPTSGLLIKCLGKMGMPKGFFLDWTAGGLAEEPQPVVTVQVKAPSNQTRAEKEARKAERRADLLRNSPPKGESPELDIAQLRKTRRTA